MSRYSFLITQLIDNHNWYHSIRGEITICERGYGIMEDYRKEAERKFLSKIVRPWKAQIIVTSSNVEFDKFSTAQN